MVTLNILVFELAEVLYPFVLQQVKPIIVLMNNRKLYLNVICFFVILIYEGYT